MRTLFRRRGYRIRRGATGWVVAAALILAACSPTSDSQQDQTTASAETAQERSTFRLQFDKDLEEINQATAALEARADDVSEKVREELLKRLRKLREEMAALRQEVIELESAGDSTFADLRPVLERRFDALKDDLELARFSAEETWPDFRQTAERYLGTLEERIAGLKRDGEQLEDEIIVGDSIRYGALRDRLNELQDRLQKQPDAADIHEVRRDILKQIDALLEEIRSATRRTEMAT